MILANFDHYTLQPHTFLILMKLFDDLLFHSINYLFLTTFYSIYEILSQFELFGFGYRLLLLRINLNDEELSLMNVEAAPYSVATDNL